MMNASDLRPIRDDIVMLQQEIINLQRHLIETNDRLARLEESVLAYAQEVYPK